MFKLFVFLAIVAIAAAQYLPSYDYPYTGVSSYSYPTYSSFGGYSGLPISYSGYNNYYNYLLKK